jgi:hypothetical protein
MEGVLAARYVIFCVLQTGFRPGVMSAWNGKSVHQKDVSVK